MPENTDQNVVAASTSQNADGEEGNLNPNELTPNESDDGAGTLAAIPSPSNEEPKYTKQQLDAAAAAARRAEKEKLKREQDEASGRFETLYQEEQRKAAELERKILVRDICDELEIPKDWRDSVSGADEAEITASAQSLKARLDKIAEEALKTHKGPGTPPPIEGGGNGEDAKKKGAEKTRKKVYETFGLSHLLSD